MTASGTGNMSSEKKSALKKTELERDTLLRHISQPLVVNRSTKAFQSS